MRKIYGLRISLFYMIVALTIINACSPVPDFKADDLISIRELEFPEASYNAVIKVDNRLVGIVYGDRFDGNWMFAYEGDRQLRRLDFPEDLNCISVDFRGDDVLPDGRLQLWKHCQTSTRTIFYLVAYNWETGEMEEIAGPLPPGSSSASWNPSQTKAIAYLDSGYGSKTLYWIWEGGFGPLDLVIKNQDNQWNLMEDYPDFKGAEVGQTGNAGRAAWSPDGNSIAFFASPYTIGKTGADRFYVEYNLYIMDSKQFEPQPLLENIYFPHLLVWSPDSKYIVFAGNSPTIKERGLWLYSTVSKSLVLIATGKLVPYLWTPSNGLIALSCNEDLECSRVVQFDFSSLVEP